MQLGIYVRKQPDLSLINKSLSFFKEEDPFFATETELKGIEMPINDLACINFYRLSHYREKILFLNEEDFNKRAGFTIAQKIVLVKKQNLVKLDKNLIKDTQILLLDKENIRKAKNAELQSVLR